jgi:threonine dehydrogenase-like Zn-dependent dehydrogenase
MWDAGCGPGDRIVVVGAGLVGLLIGALAARLPAAAVTLVDIAADRGAIAERLGARFVHAHGPEALLPRDADVVFHASASASGLALALAAAGCEARIVEMSWYGDAKPMVPLGESFHSRRLQLVASQVGDVAASRRPRWTKARRLATALRLLADERLDALITEEIAFADLAGAMPRLLGPDAPGLATAVRYPES